eukprot:13480485-Alexandrium_andersonii.AAC.2
MRAVRLSALAMRTSSAALATLASPTQQSIGLGGATQQNTTKHGRVVNHVMMSDSGHGGAGCFQAARAP